MVRRQGFTAPRKLSGSLADGAYVFLLSHGLVTIPTLRVLLPSSAFLNNLAYTISLPAVGRWQKNKDLSWYAKGDEAGKTAEELARAEEIRLIKEAEQDALSAALRFPVAPRIRDNQVAGEKDVERALKEVEVGGEEDQEVGGGKGLGYGGYGGSGAGGEDGERLGGVNGGSGGIINRKEIRPKTRPLQGEEEKRDRERRHREREERHRRRREREDERARDRPRRRERRRSPSTGSSSSERREHDRRRNRPRISYHDERDSRRERERPDSRRILLPATSRDPRELAAAQQMSPSSRRRAEDEISMRAKRRAYRSARSRSRGDSPQPERRVYRRENGSRERHRYYVWDREVEDERAPRDVDGDRKKDDSTTARFRGRREETAVQRAEGW